MRLSRLLASVLSIIGLAVVTYGIALVYTPAALIFGGGCLAAVGLLVIDVGRDDKKGKK